MISDLWRFISAVFWHWQSWAGGSGVGGAIVVLVGLYQVISGRVMPKRMYVAIFIIAFLFGAFFLAWRDQYHSALNAEAELKSKYIPQLSGEIHWVASAPSPQDKNDSIVTIAAEVSNTGAPSVAKNFSIVVTNPSKSIQAILIPPPPGELTLGANEGGDIRFSSDAWLPKAAAINPIPTNGIADGFLLTLVKGMTTQEISKPSGTRVRLSFEDASGKLFSVEYPIGQQTSFPDVNKLGKPIKH